LLTVIEQTDYQFVMQRSGMMSDMRISPSAFLLAALVLPPASLQAVPIVEGVTATQYATADNPHEIEFDSAGYLYAGHEGNSAQRIYRIHPGGGAGTLWGTQSPVDPDGIDVYGDYVYAAGQYKVWRTHRQTGVTQQWTTWTANRNMTTMTVDAAGDFSGQPGSVVVGSARYSKDIEYVPPGPGSPVTLVASGDLFIPRGLLFAAGELYCTESSANKGIWHIASPGQYTAVADGGFAWGAPSAMVYSPVLDAFLVSDTGREELVRVPRTGGAAEVVGTGFGGVYGLAIGDDGMLYASDLLADVIWRVPVPEPATLSLLALGGLGVLRRRRMVLMD